MPASNDRRWEPAELNGGKLCEAVYTVVRGLADGAFEARATKPRDIIAACKAMEKEGSQPRSVRIQIPRMIVALYEIQNNRGVGHAGGDVDPNEMDATQPCLIHEQVDRLMAEIVRIVHTLS